LRCVPDKPSVPVIVCRSGLPSRRTAKFKCCFPSSSFDDALEYTGHQISSFCRNHRSWLERRFGDERSVAVSDFGNKNGIKERSASRKHSIHTNQFEQRHLTGSKRNRQIGRKWC